MSECNANCDHKLDFSAGLCHHGGQQLVGLGLHLQLFNLLLHRFSKKHLDSLIDLRSQVFGLLIIISSDHTIKLLQADLSPGL